MAQNKVAQLILGVLLLSLPLFGQETSYDLYIFNNGQVDNASWCTSNVCWHQVNPTGTSFSQSSVGVDGTVMGVADGTVYNVATDTEPSGAGWSSIQGSVVAIHVATSDLMVALTNASSNNLWFTINGGSVWLHESTTADIVDAGIDADYDVWAVTSAGDILYEAGGGSLVTQSSGVDAVAITVNLDGTALYVNSSGDTFIYDALINTTWDAYSVCGKSVWPHAGSIGLGSDWSIAFVGSSEGLWISHDGGNTCYLMDRGTLGEGGTISDGSAVMVSYNGPGGSVEHLNTIMPIFEEEIEGTVLCLNIDDSCPNTTDHTLKAVLSFPHQFGSGSSSQTSPSTSAFNVVYQDEDPDCDPFSPGGDDCDPGTVPVSICPIVGTIPLLTEVDEPVPTSGNVYYQRYVVLSITATTHYGDAYQYFVKVAQWCTTTWEPYLNGMIIETTSSTLTPLYWDTAVIGYAGAPAAQYAVAVPSTDGANKKTDCTGYYTIPTV